MADCEEWPGLRRVTGGEERPLCVTHDRPMNRRSMTCPAKGTPAKAPPGRVDGFIETFDEGAACKPS